jgi:5-methylcytosine-specific restriction protein B
MSELSQEEVAVVAERLTISPSAPETMPALSGKATDPAGVITAAQAKVDEMGLKLPPDLITRIIGALANSNVRLMGAPGTGKSTLAEIILQARKGDEWDFALATNQWSGEDVIGGLMPDPDDPRHLIFQPGMVLTAAEADRWLGIDEINRADIDSAFGELFSLLSGFDTTLPYRPHPGSSKQVKIYAQRPQGKLDEGESGIPEGWRMIATLNSWDKTSLARVSFAFSRRWCTVYIPIPDVKTYGQILDSLVESHKIDNTVVKEALRAVFVEERETDPPSLRRLWLGLGPGIAASCAKDVASCVGLGLDHGAAFISSLEGFVLPQFEGQLEAHEDISAALGAAARHVGADDKQLRDLDERLAVFTGRRANGIF